MKNPNLGETHRLIKAQIADLSKGIITPTDAIRNIEWHFAQHDKELTKNLEVKIQLERFEERKEILEKIKSKRYRRVTGGMKQKGDLGYATNLNYCYGYNKALEDIKRKIQKS